jgi:hypothetical protein
LQSLLSFNSLRQAVRDLATLWDVKDEASAELMKRFYEGILKQGMRPADYQLLLELVQLIYKDV